MLVLLGEVAPFIRQVFPFYKWIDGPSVMLPAIVAMIQNRLFRRFFSETRMRSTVVVQPEVSV